MKYRRLASIMIVTFFLFSAVMIYHVPADAARSGDYPRNYEIQDYEPSADEQWDLDVAVDTDGRIYTVWADSRDKVPEIRFSKSLNGTSWGDGEMNNNDILVSDGPNTDERAEHPSIAVDQTGKLHCVWVDDRTGEKVIRYTSSGSSGNSWNESREISEITGTVTSPYLRYSPTTGILGLVYVLEHIRENGSVLQKDIMYTYSRDGGTTFSTPIIINDDLTEEDQRLPRMTVSPQGWFAITWQDYRNGDSTTGSNSDVYVSISNSGMDFMENMVVHSDPDLKKQEQPDISFSDKGDMMVVWQETSLDGWKVMYSMAWSNSDTWENDFLGEKVAIQSNLSRKDQFMPRVGYVDGSFLISWTELDLRNFYLIRAGYISRYGEKAMNDDVVDDSIDWGEFDNDPIYHAEMYRETVSVEGYEDRGHVFWLDYRTDPVPADDLHEDADPYTAIVFGSEDVPLPPAPLGLKVKQKDWDSIKVQWPASPDVEFKGYYLNYGVGTSSYPDENLNDIKIIDRNMNMAEIEGLKPDTEYEIKMVVKDWEGQVTRCPALSVRTEPNHPPTFEFIEPDGDNDSPDKLYELRWMVSDREERATYTLHFDDDLDDPSDQVLLYSGNTEEDVGEMSYLWNTSLLDPGGYTINATIDDGVNDPVVIYSSAVIVSHPVIVRDLPTVSFITVEGGKDNAFVDAVMEISFDRPIASTSIDDDSIYVLDGQNSKVPGIISILTADKITWRPVSHLEFGMDHRIQILPSVTDLGGNELDGERIGEPSPFSLLFTTRSASGAPTIRDWSPQGQDIPLWTPIKVVFDRPLDEETITSGTVRLIEDSTSTDVPVEITYISSILTMEIDLRRPLVSGVTYTMNLSGITSLSGAESKDFEWTFTAGEPSLDKDTDMDGTPDDLDWFRNDPSESTDTDMDGKGDNSDMDDDGDEMPDEWEMEWGFDPLDPSDADDDPDGDDVTNLEEFRSGTRPVEEDGSDINYSLIVLIFVAVAVLMVTGLIIFSLVQRKKMEEERIHSSFFRGDHPEE